MQKIFAHAVKEKLETMLNGDIKVWYNYNEDTINVYIAVLCGYTWQYKVYDITNKLIKGYTSSDASSEIITRYKSSVKRHFFRQ